MRRKSSAKSEISDMTNTAPPIAAPPFFISILINEVVNRERGRERGDKKGLTEEKEDTTNAITILLNSRVDVKQNLKI